MKRNSFLVGLISIITLTVACEKAKDGINGEDGAPGATGTANVKYSPWFTPGNYKKDTIFGIWGFNYVRPVPAITQQILDSGVVLTFAKLTGYNPAVWPVTQVAQMPVSISYMQGGVTTDTWTALASPGNLKIRFVNDRNIYNSIANTHSYRYIIIPGGLPAGRGTNFTYADICRMYNIPE